MSSSRPSRASLAALALLALLAFAPGARAAAPQPVAVPASGYIDVPRVVVRAAPSAKARVVTTLTQFETDFRARVVLALAVRKNAKGEPTWWKISLPGRPNGRTGWVHDKGVTLKPVYKEIVINRSRRTLELRDRGRLLLRTTVAVGAPGMETPKGTFYVIWGFRPPDPFLGVWAFATSAFSSLSEWPGGGIVGIHGTSAPQLLGQAVSHGCVRVHNNAILVLKRHVRPGTPIRIVG